MSYQGSYIPISNFKGGYCGNYSPTALGLNQAMALDNIVINPTGSGWRTRHGNSKLNGTVINSGAALHGIGFFQKSDGNAWLCVVSGTKFYVSPSANGTFSDKTGSVTITTGADYYWSLVTFNDKLYGFGGRYPNPAWETPFVWDSSTNLAAVGGTPPSAYGAFTANNRMFAFNSSTSPSTIYWSILGNAEDWTSSGSGSAVVGSLNDSSPIMACCQLNTNYVLIFKRNGIYQMIISSAPFPIYSLFPQRGCVGKNAVINVNGEVYWIDIDFKMRSTDGQAIKEYPYAAGDLWNATSSKASDIFAFRQTGTDYDWIVWLTANSGGNKNVAIIWDLLNECWLRCTTGYGMNMACTDLSNTVYMAGYDGYVYKPDQSTTYADASETSPGTIAAYWQSGWLTIDSLEKIVQVNEIGVLCQTRSSGSLTVYYGFDYVANSANFSLTQTVVSSETFTFRTGKVSGRGNVFNFKVLASSSSIDSHVDQIMLRGKAYGQKVITNP